MTPEEKAKELVEKFKGIVYPYIGSSMLTNETDEGVILTNSKICAIIVVDETIDALDMFGYCGGMYDDYETGQVTLIDEKHPTEYWYKVKEEINKF